MAKYRIMTPKKRNARTAGSLFVSRNSAIATAGATSAELWTPRKYIHSAGKHSSPRDRMMAQIRRNALRKRGSRFQRRIVRINRATAAIAAAAAAAYRAFEPSAPGEHREHLRGQYRRRVFAGCAKSLACQDICPAQVPVEQLLVKTNAAAIWRRGERKKK